jgi:hypothetical protein
MAGSGRLNGRIAASLALLLFAALASLSGLDRLGAQRACAGPARALTAAIQFGARGGNAAVLRQQPKTALVYALRAVAADPVDPAPPGCLAPPT